MKLEQEIVRILGKKGFKYNITRHNHKILGKSKAIHIWSGLSNYMILIYEKRRKVILNKAGCRPYFYIRDRDRHKILRWVWENVK